VSAFKRLFVLNAVFLASDGAGAMTGAIVNLTCYLRPN
jgi:hypothetical protein